MDDFRLAWFAQNDPDPGVAGTFARHFARRLTAAFVFVLMVAVLLWPALTNGFPLLFYDTGGYLARPFEHTLDIGRSPSMGPSWPLVFRWISGQTSRPRRRSRRGS